MARQLGNGKEKCLHCGGCGQVGDFEDRAGNYWEPESCPACDGSGKVASGTDPLSSPLPLQPPPKVPESQEVLKQTLTDEIARLERLGGEAPRCGGTRKVLNHRGEPSAIACPGCLDCRPITDEEATDAPA
jgi:hypothetical protein